MGIDTRAAPLEHLNTNASLNMVQITAQKACGITQAVNMMFGIGMCFFPEKMMEAYKGAPFTGDGKTMFLYVFGMMGILMAHGAMMNATMRLDSANATARGATCLGNAIGWGIFLFIDTVMAFGLPVPGVTNALPSSMPADGMKANLVLFSAIVRQRARLETRGLTQALRRAPTGVMALPLKILLAAALF